MYSYIQVQYLVGLVNGVQFQVDIGIICGQVFIICQCVEKWNIVICFYFLVFFLVFFIDFVVDDGYINCIIDYELIFVVVGKR